MFAPGPLFILAEPRVIKGIHLYPCNAMWKLHKSYRKLAETLVG
jgi:hypothetical protein